MFITFVSLVLPHGPHSHSWMEAIMQNRLIRLIITTVVATGIVAIASIGSTFAQSSVEEHPPVPQDGLANRYEPPFSETDFRLGDHQQLKGYFLGHASDGRR